jgi:hypothetical protein
MLRRVALSFAIGTCVLASPLSYDAAMSAPKGKKASAMAVIDYCDLPYLTRGRVEDTCLDRAAGLAAFAAAPGTPGAPGAPGAPGSPGSPGGPLGANPGNPKAVGNAGEFPTDKDFNFGPGVRGTSDPSDGSKGGSASASNDKGGNDKGGGKGGGGKDK